MTLAVIYEYQVLDFKICRSLIETAMIDSDELRVTIAKVLCYSIIAFTLIAAFESFVINGGKLILNMGVWVLNTGNALFFQEENVQPLPPPPVPEPTVVQPVVADETMSPIPPLLEADFKRVFEMLDSKNIITLGRNYSYLSDFKDKTKHLHPLQVVGCLLEKNSEQRKHAKFIDNTLFGIGKTFAKDTAAGFKDPVHAANTAKYIASFAQKVGITPQAARGFLLQNPPHIVDLVHYVLYRS